MHGFYEKGTEVFYWDYNDTLKKGLVDSFDADEYGIDIDEKTLLLRMLLESNKDASEAKKAMAYYNERANDICWILWGIDKNMNIKEELDNYEKEHGE